MSASSTISESRPPVIRTERNPKFVRVWLVRIIAVAIPLVCPLIAECWFRLTGKGIDPSLMLKSTRSSEANVYYLNPRSDVAYGQIDLRGPEPRGFVVPRPRDVLRVLVIGESSVQGYPYPSELAFPRQMELVLQQQLRDKQVEVLNAGIIGISTLPLRDLAEQCVQVDPSVIVLYAGHNEFYGVGGVATNSPLSPLAIPLRKTRLVQWMTDGETHESNRPGKSDAPLISRMPKEVQIPSTSPMVRQAADNFHNHIDQIAEFATHHKIPLILCSPVSNLRSQSPWSGGDLSSHITDLEQEIGEPLTRQSSSTYLDALRIMLRQDPKDALAHFRIAQCFQLMGERINAYEHYQMARDFDQCRYRAPSSYGHLLAAIAQHHGPLVTYLDLEQVFRTASEYGIPGNDLFLEHVHFTFEGHGLMARTIAKAIVESTCHIEWDPNRVPTTKDIDEWLGTIPEDHLVALYLASFIGEVAPFSQALDANQHVSELRSKIDQIERSLDPEQLKRFHSLNHQAQMDDLVDGLGRIQLSLNQPNLALAYFQKSIQRRPWTPNGYVFSASASHLNGDDKQAREYLTQSKTTTLAESPRLLNDRERLEVSMRRRGTPRPR